MTKSDFRKIGAVFAGLFVWRDLWKNYSWRRNLVSHLILFYIVGLIAQFPIPLFSIDLAHDIMSHGMILSFLFLPIMIGWTITLVLQYLVLPIYHYSHRKTVEFWENLEEGDEKPKRKNTIRLEDGTFAPVIDDDHADLYPEPLYREE